MIKIDGDKIKQLREDQGLTQLYMATAVDVTTDTISRWENRRYPSIKEENGEKLAEALGVSLEEILLMEDNTSAPEEAPSSNESSPANRTAPKPVSRKLLFTVFLSIFTVAIAIVFLIFFFTRPESISTIEAKRIMPTNAIPGSSFPVVVEIRHSSSRPLSVIVKETLPEGAEIIESSPAAGPTSNTNEIKWLKKIDGTARFSYLVKIGGPVEKTYFFSGKVSTATSDDSVEVTGRNSIVLNEHHWADNNGDNQISDQEILTVFDYYSGIDDFTVDIEFIEKMWLGSGYTWDKEKNLISILP